MLAVWTSGRIRAKSYGFDYFTLKATIKKGKRNYHFYLVVYSENRNFLFRCARWSVSDEMQPLVQFLLFLNRSYRLFVAKRG